MKKTVKKTITLSSILLLALVVPFIMQFPISVEGTSFVLFGSIFLSLLFFVVSDILPFSENTYKKVKIGLLSLIIILVLGSSFSSAIIRRHRVSPVFEVHDMPIQVEEGLRFLIHGKNPYAENYTGTALEEWHFEDGQTNPALYHFVMGPFYLLISIPFYIVSNFLFGYFDARMPLYALYAGLFVMAGFLVKNLEKKLVSITLLAFSPAVLNYVLQGRTDIAMHALLFAGLYLLYKNKWVWAGIFIAFAFATKQSAWPLFPLYAIYLYATSEGKTVANRLIELVKKLIPFGITFVAIMLPFYLWSPSDFIADTFSYLTRSIATSYPISGYGLGMLLNQLGVISDRSAYYPFIFWQIPIVLPLLYFLGRYVFVHPTVKRMIVAYGILLFVYWYLSRYFNNSHLGYISVVFMTAYLWPETNHEETN